MLALDTECYPNFWFCALMDRTTGAHVAFRQTVTETFDRHHLRQLMVAHATFGFNSAKYDLPMIALALSGADCATLKAASDELIVGGMMPWDFARKYNIEVPEGWRHIDLEPVAPGVFISLKQYGARMHAARLQDLPVEPDTWLTPEQQRIVEDYCVQGDLKNLTIPLFGMLIEPLRLRESMSKEYDTPLTSKSDAQVAEAVFKAELKRVLGYDIKRPELPLGTLIRYVAPSFIPRGPLVRQIESLSFAIDSMGSPVMPDELKNMVIKLGDATYTMGMGGLHSNESKVSHYSDDEWVLLDRDVSSYYPAIILRCNLAPQHLGEAFLQVYKRIVDRRLAAKKAKNKTETESLKITINGSFGKLGNKWSTIYAPDLMLQVTITGQLCLLMLIDAIERHHDDMQVVSANTDGIVTRVRRRHLALFHYIVAEWERATGFETEETEYRSLHSRDVNSYVAVKTDGKTKGKGEFALPEEKDYRARLQKTPSGDISIEAVHQFLSSGASIYQTVLECNDVRKFLYATRVSGGAVYDGIPIGKVVRWYHGINETRSLNYSKVSAKQAARGQTKPKKVGSSDGARPLMELPGRLPPDIDRSHYIHEAHKMLRSMGVAL